MKEVTVDKLKKEGLLKNRADTCQPYYGGEKGSWKWHLIHGVQLN